MRSRQVGPPQPQVARGPVRLGVEALEDRLVPAPLLALTTANQLLTFDTATPGTITRTVPITGLAAGGEAIVGIDYRPADGRLYGVSSASRLYTLNPVTGAATAVGGPGAFALSGVKFGVDFNPAADRLRVVSDADQNLRLNPNDGTLTQLDTPLTYAAGDPGFGANPNVAEVAYTNNFAGAASTQLFGIDSARDALVLQLPPNAGALNTVGPLGVDTTANVGFDVVRTGGNRAFAALNPTGTSSSRLYTVDLTTGGATLVGTIGGGTALVIGLASPLPKTSTVGGFDPATATWALRNAVGAGPADATFQYGGANWAGVVGDWNGDGSATVGAVDPTGQGLSANDLVWYLRNSNSAGAPDVAPFPFGSRAWVPVVGDWDGNGTTTIGAFDPATATWYLRNTNSAGPADLVFQYGGAGWLPVAGDWNGDGVDTVGVVDPTGQGLSAISLVWYLRNTNSAGAPDVAPFNFGSRTFRPVVGDWNGDTVDTVGAVDPTGGSSAANLVWFLRNSNSAGGVDFPPFFFAPSTYRPVSGDYNFPDPPTVV